MRVLLSSLATIVLFACAQAERSSIAEAHGTEAHSGRVALVAGPARFDSSDLSALGITTEQASARVWIDVKPASASKASLDPFARLGVVERHEIDMNTEFPGDDKSLAEQMSRAPCLVLSGGTWSDWWLALNPRHKVTCVGRAILDAHRRGALVVGVGAAAAYLAERSVLERTAITRPVRDPHEEGLDVVAEGLGLVEGVCIDLELANRTTPSRMLRATRTTDVQLAVWLSGSVVWIDDPSTKTCAVRGSGVAIAFDLSDARRDRTDIQGGRVSVIKDGAIYDRRAHAITIPKSEQSAAVATPPLEASSIEGAPVEAAIAALEPARLASIFASESLTGKDVSERVLRRLELCDADECVRFALDERSQRVAGSWTNVRFDFVVPARRERADAQPPTPK